MSNEPGLLNGPRRHYSPRTYLYTEDYINSEAQASIVIDHSSIYRLSGLNEAFLMNSEESIWKLQPVNFGKNTEDALGIHYS